MLGLPWGYSGTGRCCQRVNNTEGGILMAILKLDAGLNVHRVN
jgi:hypothetical protein